MVWNLLAILAQLTIWNQDYLKDLILQMIFLLPDITYVDLFFKVASTYCNYITKDAMYYEIRRLLYPNTTFQDALSTFENTWFTDHQSIEFKNVKIFDVMEFDEGFIGSISFDYVVIADDEVSKTYTSTYQLTFMNRYGQYLASNLKIGE